MISPMFLYIGGCGGRISAMILIFALVAVWFLIGFYAGLSYANRKALKMFKDGE